jgi:ribonuclease P protein component
VYEEGTAFGGPFFVLRVLGNDVGHPRWGFAVGKRLLPSAVDRNRVKRRLREASRAAGVTGSADLVLTARRASVDADFPRLVSAIRKLARRAGLEVEGREA